MKTLWDTIHERAAATFTEVDVNDKEAFKAWYNEANWVRWYDHYIASGEQVYNEFVAQGLEKTAAKMRENLDFTIHMHPKNRKPDEPMSRRVEDWLMEDGFPILLFVDPVTGERLTKEDAE